MYRCDTHAAKRWAQRVGGASQPDLDQLAIARRRVLKAMSTARCTHRHSASKARLFVTGDGVHLVVLKGGHIRTVYRRGWTLPLCRCEHCVRVRAERLKEAS